MAVLIDPPRWPAHGRLWSHVVSDRSLEELHAFAAALGIPARAFDLDHYDVPESTYAAALAAGAQAVEAKELLRRLVASGLRVPGWERRRR
jgi:tRNA isopentenyl-2-thiomethyl-A-37 hydroxylase MiaE